MRPRLRRRIFSAISSTRAAALPLTRTSPTRRRPAAGSLEFLRQFRLHAERQLNGSGSCNLVQQQLYGHQQPPGAHLPGERWEHHHERAVRRGGREQSHEPAGQWEHCPRRVDYHPSWRKWLLRRDAQPEAASGGEYVLQLRGEVNPQTFSGSYGGTLSFNAVPIPANAWLLVSALGAFALFLGWRRGRATTAHCAS